MAHRAIFPAETSSGEGELDATVQNLPTELWQFILAAPKILLIGSV